MAVYCPECGDRRDIGARQRRRVASGSGDYTCSRCRTLGPIVVTQELRDYWLDRHSLEWIVEVAEGMWPQE